MSSTYKREFKSIKMPQINFLVQNLLHFTLFDRWERDGKVSLAYYIFLYKLKSYKENTKGIQRKIYLYEITFTKTIFLKYCANM